MGVLIDLHERSPFNGEPDEFLLEMARVLDQRSRMYTLLLIELRFRDMPIPYTPTPLIPEPPCPSA